jgi:tRNA (guanine-N7-)-methyltransferase
MTPGDPPEGVAHPRAIRSFVRRAGRITTGQTKAFATLGPQFLLPHQAQMLDADACFDADFKGQPLVLEIGFGMGEATAHIAQTLPQTRFLCCEVHEPGVGALLKRIGEHRLSNIRIIAHDAVEVLRDMIAPESLDGVHLFFPDPWHKKRHHKRRLVQPPLVHELALRLKPGGYIHMATDWLPYADQMLQVLSAEPLLANISTHPEGWADKPHYRPLTKFENRGLQLGHGVRDLVFQKK